MIHLVRSASPSLAVVLSLASAALASGLSGCSSLSVAQEVDYQAAKSNTRPLEVPPDLVRPAGNDRFSVPASGIVSQADFQRQQVAAGPTASADSRVLPNPSGMKLESIAGQRVLVVERPAAELWPIMRQFWSDNGFILVVEQPEIGLLETDWAENKAKLPRDFIRRTVGSLLDGIYDTGERDKYRMRLSSRADGKTEITIAHRGLVEVLTTSNSVDARPTWTNRPSDPGLEETFLRRAMLRLGANEESAKAILADAPAAGLKPAQLIKTETSSSIQLAESFDRAWRRVGLAIDRLGFAVEDRNRDQGVYFIRYRDPTADQDDSKGFFGRLLSSSEPGAPQVYQLKVTEADGRSTVVPLNKNGQPTNDKNAQRMMSVLADQIR